MVEDPGGCDRRKIVYSAKLIFGKPTGVNSDADRNNQSDMRGCALANRLHETIRG
jgi:hypothetical protein